MNVAGNGRATPSIRIAGVALLVVAAVMHIALIFQFGMLVLGILFALSAAGMLLGAVLIYTKAETLGWVLGGGTSLLTVLGYIMRSTVGLPGVLPQPFPFFTPISGPISVLIEVIAVGLAVRVLVGLRRANRAPQAGVAAES